MIENKIMTLKIIKEKDVMKKYIVPNNRNKKKKKKQIDGPISILTIL